MKKLVEFRDVEFPASAAGEGEGDAGGEDAASERAGDRKVGD